MSKSDPSRRDFLRASSVIAAPLLAQAPQSHRPRSNVILVISDQFRWDCLGVNARTPLGLTPNLDEMARDGVNFANAITNQPVCAPSRCCIFTGQYASRHGVWRNGPSLPTDSVTIASVFRSAGYSANYIGKWHLAPEDQANPATLGHVPPQYRGGFDDLWEGCNVLERTSHPYEGSIWDGAGREIRFQDVYRVDFLTDRVLRFLQQPREPFFLVVSYLEPHHQNDCNCFVAPKGYADRYRNAFVPRDLSFFPGDWQAQLPDYYGCLTSVDENVGRLRDQLRRSGLADRTIVAFTSDHGCHFRTRNAEYKRSGHESSIHIPLAIMGPGFPRGRVVNELVSHVDLGATLLDSVGIGAPASTQGRSYMALVEGNARDWRNEVFVQISESMTGRALRTPQWAYVVAQPDGTSHPSSSSYTEYQLYDLFSDPDQLVNLAGRRQTRDVSTQLRSRLVARMTEAGESPAEIKPAALYP